MTKLMTRTLLLISSLFSFSSIAADDAISTGIFSDLALDGYDTVAYFTESKPTKGSKKYRYKWRDATWQFVSEENLNVFKLQPTKYAPQYGAYCAWAMAGGKTASVDPDVWHILDGKLYLNYNRNVQKEWFDNMQNDIISADKFYPQITNVTELEN